MNSPFNHTRGARQIVLLELEGERRVGVLDDTPPAVAPDDPAALGRHPLHLLDVELLEAAAVVGEGGDAAVRHLGASLDRQLLEVGRVLGEALEPGVGYVAFACNNNNSW